MENKCGTSNKKLLVAHVTNYNYLRCDIKYHQLRPRFCKEFDKSVVYLSYGLPFYKPKEGGYISDASRFPIVIFFCSDVNDLIDDYYPFDTGAVLKGYFGKKWYKLKKIDDYKIKKVPERMVSAYYESNENYSIGKVRSELMCDDEKVKEVYNFLKDRFNSGKIDQRHRTIECVKYGSLEMNGNIYRIAFPSKFMLNIEQFIDKYKYNLTKEKLCPYETDFCEEPGEVVTHIKKDFYKHNKHLFE